MSGEPLSIQLLGISSQYVHASLAPWCLKKGLESYAKAPYTARVVEGTVNERPEQVLNRVAEVRPRVLAICCYIWNISYIRALLPRLRAVLPDTIMVLGGPEVSYRAEDALRSLPEADYLIAGEGELPLAKLLDALAGRGERDDVPGLCCRTARGLMLKPPYIHPAMPPSPIGSEYIEALQGRIAYLETSRGCPYSCAFCLSGRGEKLREQPLEEAFQDLLALAGSGAKTIKLVDRTFNANRRRAETILRFLSDKAKEGVIPPGITFHFEVAGDLLDEGTLAVVAGAPRGLFQFEIGLQSMDEDTLKAIRRKTDLDKWEHRVRKLIEAGTAHVHLDLIAGLTGEDLAAFIRGFDRVYALRPQALQLGFLKLIHGCAMREEPETYPCAFDPNPPYQVLSTPWMSKEDLDSLAVAETALNRLHNSGRFPRTLHYLTYTLGLAPYQLFFNLGQAILEAGDAAQSLDGLTNLLYGELARRYPEEETRLYDLLLLDRLASIPTTVLPRCLKRKDKRFFQVKRALEQRFPRPHGTARAVAFVYHGAERAVFCDYAPELKDPVTELYPVAEVGLEEL